MIEIEFIYPDKYFLFTSHAFNSKTTGNRGNTFVSCYNSSSYLFPLQRKCKKGMGEQGEHPRKTL